MRLMRFGFMATVMAASAALLCACGKKNYLNENDTLRARLLEQQKEIDDLKRRTEEQRIALEDLAASPGSPPEDVLQATPHAVELSIGGLTHVSQLEGGPDQLRLYLHPIDGRGRFTQLVGTIQISVFLLPMSEQPSTIGQLTATPLQVRDAYRHSLMSTHYGFDVPLSMPPAESASANPATLFVRVVFTNGYTGRTLTAEKSISVK